MGRTVVLFLIAVVAPALLLAFLAIRGTESDLEGREAAIRGEAEEALAREVARVRSILDRQIDDALSALAHGAADASIFVGSDGIPHADPSGLSHHPERERSLWQQAVARGDSLAFAANVSSAARDAYADALASIRETDLRADLLARIARSYARAGDRGSAALVFARIESEYPDAISPDDGLPLALLAQAARANIEDHGSPDPRRVSERLFELRHRLRPAAIRRVASWFGIDLAPDLARYVEERERIEEAFAAVPRPFRGDAFLAGASVFVFRPLPEGRGFAGAAIPLAVEAEAGGSMLRAGFRPPGAGGSRPSEDNAAAGDSPIASGPVRVSVAGKDLEAGTVTITSPEIVRLHAAASQRRTRVRIAAALLAILIAGAGLGLARALRRERSLLAFRSLLVEQVSHEIRTPASSIATCAALLACEDLAADEGRRYRRLLSAEARRLGFVVENVIDASRPGRETGDLDVAPLDPEAVIRETVEALRPRFEEEGVDLEVAIESLPEILGDRKALGRILYNLLDNALKYRSRERPSWVRIRARVAEDGQVEIEVSDNGRGVPPDLARRIFEPQPRRDPDVPGTGMGLAISRRLAEHLGGELLLDAGGAEGTTFRLILAARGSGGAPWTAG